MREDIKLKITKNPRPMVFTPSLVTGMPFTSDSFESICPDFSAWATFCSALGSMPCTKSFLASSRFALACASVTVGQTPKARRSSFLSEGRRYFMRQYLEPLAETSRYKPPPSAILYVLSFGFAVSTCLALSFIWGHISNRSKDAPNYAPNDIQISTDNLGRLRT